MACGIAASAHEDVRDLETKEELSVRIHPESAPVLSERGAEMHLLCRPAQISLLQYSAGMQPISCRYSKKSLWKYHEYNLLIIPKCSANISRQSLR